MPNIVTNASALGASTPTVWGGGAGQFQAAGTFNGSTATLQAKNADQTYTDVAGTALTADGRALFSLPPCSIRVNFTGAAPTSVTADAWRIRNP